MPGAAPSPSTEAGRMVKDIASPGIALVAHPSASLERSPFFPIRILPFAHPVPQSSVAPAWNFFRGSLTSCGAQLLLQQITHTCLFVHDPFYFAGFECCIVSTIEQIAILIGQIEAGRKLQVGHYVETTG